MQFSYALILSILAAAAVYGLLRYNRRKIFSSLILALIIGLLVLGALANPMDIANTSPDALQLYGIISLIIVVLVVIYVCVKVDQDVETNERVAVVPGMLYA